MPFKSKRQWRAFFSGRIPGIDKEKAREWAHETKTPFKKLPDRAPNERGKPTLRSKEKQAAFSSAVLRGMRIARQSGAQVPMEREASRWVNDAVLYNPGNTKSIAELTKKELERRGYREQERKRRHRQRPFWFSKEAEDVLSALCTKIAATIKLPKPLAPVSSRAAARARTANLFKGMATSEMLKPPGPAASRIAVNPRRHLRQAMNAFRA